VATILVSLNSPTVQRAIYMTEVESGGDRVYYWEAGAKAIQKFPIFGLGGDESASQGAVARYAPAVVEDKVMHNTYLEVAVEYGLFALIFYLALVFFVLKWGYRLFKFALQKQTVLLAAPAVSYLILMIAAMFYDIGPLLAGAGVLGVALGFGSQSLVKDFLSGIFMVLEDQYGVGDVVDVGPTSGTVEAVSLRVTRLRDVEGTVWYVRNGEILRLGNKSQGWARAVLDIPVGYDEDVARVQQVMLDVARQLADDEQFGPLVLEQPEVWGIEAMTQDTVTVHAAVDLRIEAPGKNVKIVAASIDFETG